MAKKRIAILGSTGSIGRQALDVIRDHRDRFEVVALAAHRNLGLLEEQISEFEPAHACLSAQPSPAAARTPDFVKRGPAEVVKLLEVAKADMVLNAITGGAGLEASARTLELGADLALANKESLVMAGSLLRRLADENGAAILPVDSEHSAIFQCLRAGNHSELRRLHLTASGGPFRGYDRDRLATVTLAEALHHPTWKMGRKITIDSATLMNKGLEVIEAHALFDIAAAAIEVVVHPQSIVHSLVEFQDGSLLAHMGAPDMRIPIQYALSHPERLPRSDMGFSLAEIARLDFEAPDLEAFPALSLAYRALDAGGTAPALLNAANERAVELFLEERIPFLAIPELIERALDQHTPVPINGIDQVLAVDQNTREIINRWI